MGSDTAESRQADAGALDVHDARIAHEWRTELVARDHVIGLEASLEAAQVRADHDAARLRKAEADLKRTKAALKKARAEAARTPSIRSSLRAIARRVKQRLRRRR